MRRPFLQPRRQRRSTAAIPWREKDGKIWYSWTAFDPSLEAWVGRRARSASPTGGSTPPAAGRCRPQQLQLPTIVNLELGRARPVPLVRPVRPGDRAADDGARAESSSRPIAARPIGSAISPTTRSAGGPARCSSSIRRSRPTISPSSAGSRCCASITATIGARFTADFVPPAGVESWAGAARSDRSTTHMRARRRTASRRCANGPASSPSTTTRWPSRRSAPPIPTRSISATGCRSITTRPRCGRWRRHVDAIADQLQPRQPATAGSRIISSTGCEKLSGGKPVLVSEWFFAANENRTGNRNNGHLMTVETQAERAARRRRGGREFRRHPGDRRHPLVPVLRPPERRPPGRRGLRFRPRRHQRPALSSG